MSKSLRVRLAPLLAFLSVACSLPSYALADIKAHCMVLKERADAYPTPTSDEDKAFADLDSIATAQDITPLATASIPTPTSTPPFFTPRLNVYCRSGPGTSHSSISLATRGQSYPIDARNPEGTWYFLRVSPSAECWVFAGTGTASGDAAGVRVIQPIPTPALAPPVPVVSCSQHTTPQSCAQYPQCTWNRIAVPGICQAR
jgi:uncharacterized protein YraI